MIEDLEYELTGALQETSNTDNLEVDREEKFHEAVTAESKASK